MGESPRSSLPSWSGACSKAGAVRQSMSQQKERTAFGPCVCYGAQGQVRGEPVLGASSLLWVLDLERRLLGFYRKCLCPLNHFTDQAVLFFRAKIQNVYVIT